MRKALLFFTLLVTALFPLGVQAQSNIHFSNVTVEIWPEYDQPSVLVIYHLVLAEDVTLPASVDLRIPKDAKVNAVAVSDASGTLITAEYQSSVSGSQQIVTFSSDNRNIQVEYYDPYTLQGNTRQYTYTWPGNYSVDSFAINFQQPVDATGLTLTPALGSGVVAADGLTYYNATIGALALNQEYTLQVEYQKTTDALSSSGVQPSAPLDANVQGRTSFSAYLPWILGVLGGLLVLGGLAFGLYYWRLDKKHTPQTERRHRSTASGGTGGDVFCSQCGKRAQPGDVFCRTCGTRLRRTEP